jgi:transcriptional antiterminator RfaH
MTRPVPAWFSVWTKPKHEHIAAAGLRRNLGLELFLPRLHFKKATRRGWQQVTEPLFPGYIFVHCIMEDRIHDIQYTNGVKRIVQFGGKIPPVPDSVIQELQNHFGSSFVVAIGDALSPGDTVSVASGAFAGMDACVLRMLPAKQRVQILLEILGRPTAVEVARHLLVSQRNTLTTVAPFLAAVSDQSRPSAARI